MRKVWFFSLTNLFIEKKNIIFHSFFKSSQCPSYRGYFGPGGQVKLFDLALFEWSSKFYEKVY